MKYPRRSTLLTLLLTATLLLIAIPLGIWSGLSDPRRLNFVIHGGNPAWANIVAGALAVSLLAIPMVWVISSGILDLLAFFLVQDALLMAGYFFLPITAWNLEASSGEGILRAAPLVVLINAVGFSVLLITLSLTYLLGAARHVRLQPLHDIPDEYDLRLKWFLRVGGLVILCFLALPMLFTGIVPLFAENATIARHATTESDSQRALYNMGAALMPFVTGGLVLFCVRRPIRFLGIDGFLILSSVLAQLLSGNRYPLALATFVSFSLLTMERKFKRPLLAATFALCMFAYMGLSGFTGLLRENRTELQTGSPVVQSIQAAFLGDNLIDVRDAAWVISKWDFDPLNGITYLGGLTSMLPSGMFPQKKEWHLGNTALRIVGWDPESHFGLRVSSFGEAFLNFGLAGIITLGMILGIFFGSLLRAVHQAAKKRPACLHYNLKLVILMQICMQLENTSDAFRIWSLCGFLLLQWLAVDCTLSARNRSSQPLLHATSST